MYNNITSYEELCSDFYSKNIAYNRRSGTEKGSVHFVSIIWENGCMSSNDLLRKYLQENNINYINDFNGTVWFIYNGEWTRTSVFNNRLTGVVAFRRYIF